MILNQISHLPIYSNQPATCIRHPATDSAPGNVMRCNLLEMGHYAPLKRRVDKKIFFTGLSVSLSVSVAKSCGDDMRHYFQKPA